MAMHCEVQTLGLNTGVRQTGMPRKAKPSAHALTGRKDTASNARPERIGESTQSLVTEGCGLKRSNNMIIIYGKENCPQCNLAKLACDIRSVPYEYKMIGVDATPDELTQLAGVPIRSAPVIFKRHGSGQMQYIGGDYKEL